MLDRGEGVEGEADDVGQAVDFKVAGRVADDDGVRRDLVVGAVSAEAFPGIASGRICGERDGIAEFLHCRDGLVLRAWLELLGGFFNNGNDDHFDDVLWVKALHEACFFIHEGDEAVGCVVGGADSFVSNVVISLIGT